MHRASTVRVPSYLVSLSDFPSGSAGDASSQHASCAQLPGVARLTFQPGVLAKQPSAVEQAHVVCPATWGGLTDFPSGLWPLAAGFNSPAGVLSCRAVEPAGHCSEALKLKSPAALTLSQPEAEWQAHSNQLQPVCQAVGLKGAWRTGCFVNAPNAAPSMPAVRR